MNRYLIKSGGLQILISNLSMKDEKFLEIILDSIGKIYEKKEENNLLFKEIMIKNGIVRKLELLGKFPSENIQKKANLLYLYFEE